MVWRLLVFGLCRGYVEIIGIIGVYWGYIGIINGNYYSMLGLCWGPQRVVAQPERMICLVILPAVKLSGA